jgi:serine/threonine protein kinase
VLEYIDGGSLQDIVDKGGCTDEEMLAAIAFQTLLGLDFLHSHGQFHRDIKPGLLLLLLLF